MLKVFNSLRQPAVNACRCPSCAVSHTTSSTVRRAGSIATQSTRTSIFTSTTILCSGIATAAAFVDADSKTRRRQQWDKVIAELQDEITAIQSRHDQLNPEDFDSSTLLDASKKWLDLVPEYHLSNGRNPASIQRPDAFLPHSLDTAPAEQKQTWKKIAITNLVTRGMMVRLLGDVAMHSGNVKEIIRTVECQNYHDNMRVKEDLPTTAGYRDSRTATYLNWPRQKLNTFAAHISSTLRRVYEADENLVESTPYIGQPLQVWVKRRPNSAKVAVLNAKLRNIFASAESDSESRYRALALAMDAMNQIVVMPDLHTYNILIAGLMRLNIPLTTRTAIDALRHSTLGVDDVTISLALQHLTTCDYRDGFNWWFRAVRGMNRGLTLLHSRRAPYLLKNTNSHSAAPRRAKFKRVPWPSHQVITAVMMGKLHFEGIEAALQTYDAMRPEGWELNLDSLGPLIRYCAAHRDVEAGKRLWQLALHVQRDAQETKWTAAKELKIPRHVYAAMLNLHDRSGTEVDSTFLQRFEHEWNGSTSRTPPSISAAVDDSRPALMQSANGKRSTAHGDATRRSCGRYDLDTSHAQECKLSIETSTDAPSTSAGSVCASEGEHRSYSPEPQLTMPAIFEDQGPYESHWSCSYGPQSHDPFKIQDHISDQKFDHSQPDTLHHAGDVDQNRNTMEQVVVHADKEPALTSTHDRKALDHQAWTEDHVPALSLTCDPEPDHYQRLIEQPSRSRAGERTIGSARRVRLAVRLAHGSSPSLLTCSLNQEDALVATSLA